MVYLLCPVECVSNASRCVRRHNLRHLARSAKDRVILLSNCDPTHPIIHAVSSTEGAAPEILGRPGQDLRIVPIYLSTICDANIQLKLVSGTPAVCSFRLATRIWCFTFGCLGICFLFFAPVLLTSCVPFHSKRILRSHLPKVSYRTKYRQVYQ